MHLYDGKTTVVNDNINIMKTTFECNFDLYQAFKQHGYTKIWKQKEAVNLISFSFITCNCKLVIRKKLVNIILILSLTTVCTLYITVLYYDNKHKIKLLIQDLYLIHGLSQQTS